MKYVSKSKSYAQDGPYLKHVSGGSVVQVSRYHEADARVRETPADVTDDDLAVIESFAGVKHADGAAAAREAARHQDAPATVAATKAASPDLDARLKAGTRLIERVFCSKNDEPFDRAAALTRVAERLKSVAPVRVGVYDGAKYRIAVAQLQTDPKGLTPEDLEQLATVDKDLGERARAAKAGYVVEAEKEAPANLATIPVSVGGMFAALKALREDLDFTVLSLIHRSRECVARLDALEAFGATRAVKGSSSLEAEVAALRACVSHLEARPTLTYEGVWDASKTYTPGAFVSHQGGVWHCELLSTGLVPSQNHHHWKLAVKAGRNAR